MAIHWKKQKSAILLTQCITEIVDNSIDARAKNITIRIDPTDLWIKVSDDGVGVQNLQAFWDFGNVADRPGIGSWGLGAKYAWAMLVEGPLDTRMEFITHYKDSSGKILGAQSYKDMSDVDANEFDVERIPASKMGTGTELKISSISKKFREIIRREPHRLQNVLGMIYKSTLEKGEITMTVEIMEEKKSEKLYETYPVTPFDLIRVAQGEILRKTYELEKGRNLTMTAIKVCEESRQHVQHALMQDSCSGVFVEYRGRILCQLNLRNSLTLTSGLIVICNLEGTWITNPNKSESIQGDENDLCLATIIDDLRIWAEKNQENCASLKTNERLSKELNDLMDWVADDCDCGAGDECKKTIVPKIARKGKTPNPSSTRKEPSEKKDKSIGDKKKNDKAYEVKLVRAPLDTCSQWSKDGKVLTITICSALYTGADLNVWGPSSPFYRDVMESFSRFKISNKRHLDAQSLFDGEHDQSRIEPDVKKEMLEAIKSKRLAKNAIAKKVTPAKV